MQTIKLDLSCYEIPQTILAKQGDVGRKFMVQLMDKNRDYTIPEGATLSIWYSGASGGGNYKSIGARSAFRIDGNTVTVEMITQMLACKGDGMMCLMLNSADGTQIAMWNIPYTVEAVPGFDSPGAQQYFTALSEAIRETTMNAEIAQAAAVKAANMVQSKLSIGLYSRTNITVDSTGNTKTFWNQVFDIYDSMPVERVEIINVRVLSPYSGIDSNEPTTGDYRVTITKSADHRYGFVEAVTYVSSAVTWQAPVLMTRIRYAGTWQDTQWPLKNIYNSVHTELLWSNASKTTVLASQTIALPNRAKEYDALLLLVNLDTSYYYTIPVLLRKGGDGNACVAYFPACSYAGRSWVACWRYFFLGNDGVSLTISDGYRDGFISNSRAIPYKIYGVRI